MADTAAAAKPKPEKVKSPAKAAKPGAPAKTGEKEKKLTKEPRKKRGQVRNYDLGCGVMRFSRSRMFHKKALWKFLDKKTPRKPKPKRKMTVTKEIGGEKNGKTRLVYLKKRPSHYPTQKKINKHPSKKLFSEHRRRFRKTLVPGAVVILLAGVHKGRRAVVMKRLRTGLLLVNGPFTLNGVPLRRIHPNYVIGTSVRLNTEDIKIPKEINDQYFKRIKPKRTKKDEGEIFAAKKEKYKPSEQRKTDQKIVDKMTMAAIKKHPDACLLRKYLCTMFGFRSSQFPHRMKF